MLHLSGTVQAGMYVERRKVKKPDCYQEVGGLAEYYTSQGQYRAGSTWSGGRRRILNVIRRRGDQPSTTPLRYSTGQDVRRKEEGEET